MNLNPVGFSRFELSTSREEVTPSQSYLMSFKHLSQTERYQIYALTKAGHKPVEIAKLLGRHRDRSGPQASDRYAR
jgi:hypothetical protein